MHLCQKKGFTLIEVLLVIAILAILASIVIVAINPAKQFSSARDAQRQSDVYAILNAMHQYALDNEGSFPSDITQEEYEICKTGSITCEGLYDLSDLTTEEMYLVTIPQDPQCIATEANCSENGTGYYLSLTANGRVTVSAYGAENGEITVTR